MHPLLLFALFFIPGIKTSYLRYEELDNLRTNELINQIKTDLKNGDVEGLSKILNWKTGERSKGLKKPQYDTISTELEKPRTDHVELRQESNSLQTTKAQTNYISTPSPEYHQYRFNDKHLYKKHYKKGKHTGDEKFKVDKYKRQHLEEFTSGEKKFDKNMKKIKNGKPRDVTSEFWSDENFKKYIKSTKEFLKKHRSFDIKKFRKERVKREDSSVINESYHHGDEYDDKTHENIEKTVIEHLHQDINPDDTYKDITDIDIKNDDKSIKKVPVVEKLFTKSKAYLSCNHGSSCTLNKHHVSDDTNQVIDSKVKETQMMNTFDNQKESKPNDEEDLNDWLKDLEDQIIL